MPKRFPHDCDGLGFVTRQDIEALDQGDCGAEPAKRLGELHADGPAANDDQMIRPLAEFENRLVCEIPGPIQPGDRRNGRARPRRDHKAPGSDQNVTRNQQVWSHETPFRLEHLHAEAGKAFYTVMRCDGGYDGMNMRIHPAEVNIWRNARYSEPVTGSHRLRALCCGNQSFRGNAPGIQTIAAHPAALDKRDLCAHLRGACGDREPTRAPTDNAEVEALTHCGDAAVFIVSAPVWVSISEDLSRSESEAPDEKRRRRRQR